MSLKSINSDDLTAFSTTSSSNVESNAAVDGVSSFLKDDVCFTQEQSSREALKNSLYDSLFKKDSLTDGTVNDNLLSNASRSPWADFVGEASCSPKSSPSPSRIKDPSSVPCVSPSDSNHSGTTNWNSMASNLDSPAPVANDDTQNVGGQSPYISRLSSPAQQQYSPSYNHVSYDFPSCSKSQQKSHTMGLLDTQPPYANLGTEYSPFSSISTDCFNAAISEDTVPKHSQKTEGNHVTKLKQLKYRYQASSDLYDKDHKAAVFSRSNKPMASGMITSISSHVISKETYNNSSITRTTFTTVTTPCLQKIGPASPGSSKSLGSNDQQGLNPDLKKYRYNQTALALQQSGLMKTTIKTAELLRKSKLLQQELLKLRKETAVFMHSVLNNPENKHLKDFYLPKKERPPSDSQ